MRRIGNCLCAALLAAGALAAQGGVAPPHLTAFGPDPLFAIPTLPGTSHMQIHMVPYPGKPGFFIVGLTVNGLPAANGGVAGSDLLTGIYDAVSKTFTPDLNAAGLNTASGEFGLSLHASGLLAAYETTINSVYGVQIAQRPDLTSPFKWIGSVANMPANGDGYWDPSLADAGGVLHLLFMQQRPAPNDKNGDIAMAPLDLKAMSIGTPKVIITTPVVDQKCNSSTPILDSTGELIGVSHHVTVNSNDHYISFDLDPATPTLELITTSTWINNGGFAAGTFFDGESGSPYRINSVETVWWIAGPAELGKKMEIASYCPIGKTKWVSFLMLSAGFLKSPMKIPGVGLFGLDPATLVPPLTVGVHGSADGAARLGLLVPKDPVLKGVTIPGQSLVYDSLANQFYLGNTAALAIR